VKNLWLGLTLIALASGLLLLSDLGRRRNAPRAAAAPEKRLRLAVMQWASTDLQDHTVAGILEGLRQQGFAAGRNADIRLLNAAGDNATGNAMAQDLAGGGYDLVLTASTLALQAQAKANAAGRVVHVFGCVTDPYGAGVGISGPKPEQHPPHLVGVGTFQPVERTFRIARRMNPRVTKIGVVWNPGETNSEAQVHKARAICKELGIELLEANAGNTSEIPESIRAVLARGAEAVWVGGDSVATSALSAIVGAARAAKVPVFSNDPSDTAKGALFSLGASYKQVGIAVGEMGGKILHGASPRTFGVENLVPEVLTVNEAVTSELAGWTIPAEIRAQAQASAAAATAATTPAPATPAAAVTPPAPRLPQPGRIYKVGILPFGAHPMFDQLNAGIRETLGAAGFIESRNLVLSSLHPNGDMSLLPQVARQLADQELDLIIPLCTPCLGAILACKPRMPVVFGAVSSPVEAGAGKSYTDHLPRVTGAVWTAPSPTLFRWLKTLYPACKVVGVVYSPSDANSMREKETARALLAECGMSLVERTIANSSEISQAAQSLLSANVDAVFGMADNTVVSGFAALDQVCQRHRLPVVADDFSEMGSGALYSCGASPQGEGRHTGQMAARVLLGENPATMPFEPTTEMETTVDLAAAARLGVTLPPELLREASFYHHASARLGRPFRLALITLTRTPLLDAAEQGLRRGLGEAGFKEKDDFTVKRFEAQDEATQLPALLAAARAEAPDLVVTVTTPALLVAAQLSPTIPLVFTAASGPAARALLISGNRPAHCAGVLADPATERRLESAPGPDAARSALDLYAAWGAQSGRLAAKVLAGLSPRDLPIETLRLPPDSATPDLPSATPTPTPTPSAAKSPARPWTVCIVRYNDAQFATDTERGVRDGFKKLGLQEGRDLTLRTLNAQGDMTTLTSIVTAVRAERPDLVMTISTPALQAALRQITDLPLVFGCVADGVVAGAGTSPTEHRPNVTGISSRHPAEGMARLLKLCVPGLRAVGTLFSPGEVNAEHNRKLFAAALEQEGLKLIAVPVNSSTETVEATTALLRSDIQIICQVMDNTTRPAFSQIAKRADEAGLAFFCFDSSALRDGATLALARDFYDTGSETAALAVRILHGEAPQGIPLTNARTEVLMVNPELLKKRGLVLPPEYAAKAQTVQTKDP
jgi:ABC-type uncharacterized transport system substrate-binding protein